MKKLSIELENCYGIRTLKREFDFTEQRAYAIYAPNGAMKSSLAQTFMDVADGIPSKDRVFPARATVRKITDENGTELPKESVLVIRPYDEFFGHTEKTSTLLVDAKLRTEYEKLHEEIDKAKATLLQALKEQSGSKMDLEREVSSTFMKREDKFYDALFSVKDELLAQTGAPFAEVKYDKIFDDKVLDFLGTEDVKTALEDYIRKYNELLDASTYFRRGTFNYYNASTIAKSLAANGFFNAKHTVRLNADKSVEITKQSELDNLIAREKEGISNNADLRNKFAGIEKLITKNVSVRDFHAYLAEHEDLLPSLANIESFREDIWKSYLKARIDLYIDVTDRYKAAENRMKEIEQEAAKQRTQWEKAISIFTDRFFVPFTLTAKNKISVVLGGAPLLTIGYVFKDGEDETEVDKSTLMEVLSNGEKKALYILNIIFEIEARKKAKQETVFVIDDIADSFDYKNKYAIIQYLNEITEEPTFNQVILTHNFDFFRTVSSRFVKYSHCLMAFRNGNEITLLEASGIKNIFVNDWKPRFFTDPKKRIASIPFIRNIIEYTKGDQDPTYIKLTSLLHWKPDSTGITEGDLDSIYKAVFGGTGAWPDGSLSVIDSIAREANLCRLAGDGANFENKIVLSIAIRIAAEHFMVQKISDPGFLASIKSDQTAALFDKYRKLNGGEANAIETIQRVMLMTPENIHLNSFMYEPILDMSDEHLRKLYVDVLKLTEPVSTQDGHANRT